MKKLLLTCIIILSSYTAKGQSSNIIPKDEFEAIKVNNVTLKDLKKTYGKQAKVEALLGSTTSYEANENDFYYYFKFNGLNIDFSTGQSKPYIESFEIINNASTLSLKGITITVGDNISKLGDVVLSVGRRGVKSVLFTVCEDCDSFVNIEFDQSTNVITKISYLDMS